MINITTPSMSNQLDQHLILLEDNLRQQSLLDTLTRRSIAQVGNVAQRTFVENAILNKTGHNLWGTNKSKKASATRKRLTAARALSAEEAAMLQAREEARKPLKNYIRRMCTG